ncbi:PIG-L family deacetylase [Streptomyces sp. NPDC094448]|uniref:PIG-L family deacetylase n=1 Tax=Streptomyces sp. NPDC094448 TaxID=3366063 RepID=UPI00382316A2
MLLLSPHPDDIAWSLGGTVARLRETGTELVCLTFFNRTRYAPGSPAHGDSDAVTRVRRAEEDRWGALTGVRLERCELADASLRGYDDDTEMGAEPEPEVVAEAAARLSSALLRLRPDAVLAPLAVGGHIDHSAVRRAVSGPLPVPEDGLLWYEDLPYAFGADGAPEGHPLVVGIASHETDRDDGVRCYPSQLPDEVLPVLRAHAARVRGERLWAGTPAARDRFGRGLGRVVGGGSA